MPLPARQLTVLIAKGEQVWQLRQVVEPETLAYVPAEQLRHPVTKDVVVEKVPTSHAEQVLNPKPELYLPAVQLLHTEAKEELL